MSSENIIFPRCKRLDGLKVLTDWLRQENNNITHIQGDVQRTFIKCTINQRQQPLRLMWMSKYTVRNLKLQSSAQINIETAFAFYNLSSCLLSQGDRQTWKIVDLPFKSGMVSWVHIKSVCILEKQSWVGPGCGTPRVQVGNGNTWIDPLSDRISRKMYRILGSIFSSFNLRFHQGVLTVVSVPPL